MLGIAFIQALACLDLALKKGLEFLVSQDCITPKHAITQVISLDGVLILAGELHVHTGRWVQSLKYVQPNKSLHFLVTEQCEGWIDTTWNTGT